MDIVTPSEEILVGTTVGLVLGILGSAYLFFVLKSYGKINARDFHVAVVGLTLLIVGLVIVCPIATSPDNRLLLACINGCVLLSTSLSLFAISYYVKPVGRKYYRIIAFHVFLSATLQLNTPIWWIVRGSMFPFEMLTKIMPIIGMITCELWFLSKNNQQFLPKRLK